RTHHPHAPLIPLIAHPEPPRIDTLSLHDALPISIAPTASPSSAARPPRSSSSASVSSARSATTTPSTAGHGRRGRAARWPRRGRSEEHTSELQSPYELVCRLLLEKKKLPPH